MDNTIYNWSFSNDKNRWSLWYIIALSVVIWLVIWWFLTSQYVMSFLFILITWVSFFIDNNSRETTDVFITDLWIKINNTFFDFSKISSYSILYEWDNAILLRLNLIKKWVRFLDLKINSDIALNLKNILPNYIAEDEMWELSFIDKMIRILKL